MRRYDFCLRSLRQAGFPSRGPSALSPPLVARHVGADAHRICPYQPPQSTNRYFDFLHRRGSIAVRCDERVDIDVSAILTRVLTRSVAGWNLEFRDKVFGFSRSDGDGLRPRELCSPPRPARPRRFPAMVRRGDPIAPLWVDRCHPAPYRLGDAFVSNAALFHSWASGFPGPPPGPPPRQREHAGAAARFQPRAACRSSKL